MKVDYAIVGGGLAGLCTARRLIELGIQPLVIEAGNYPTHKVCGEFLSSSSLPILEKWNIHPIPIQKIFLYTHTQTLELTLPNPAGSLSHMTLDPQIAQQISKGGGILLTNTIVNDFSIASKTNDFHSLSLSNGKMIQAKNLFIATGRLGNSTRKSPPIRYMGFKAHFSGIKLQSALNMFSLKGAYLGLAPIENNRVNLACLANISAVKKFPTSQLFMEYLLNSHPQLRELLDNGVNLFQEWMEVSAPQFGQRSNPSWPQTYWIGDANGTIPPASGNGLSLAIQSGCLAAEYAVKNDPEGFKNAWKKNCSTQFLFAKGLNILLLSPSWCDWALKINRLFPKLASGIYSSTRSH